MKSKKPLFKTGYKHICLLVFVVFIFNGFLTIAFSRENDPLTLEEREWLTQHDGEIVLGHDPSAKPIDFYDENGNFKGLAADYIHLIEQKLNFKFKLSKNKTWSGVVEKAKRKEIDVLCTFSKTPERAEWMNFTEPYIKIPAVILVRNEIEGKLSLDQMQGMKITFPKGWVIEEYLRNNHPQLNLVPAINEKTAIENVSIGVSDAAVTALTSAIVNVEKSKIPNLKVAGETGYFFNLAMASRKDWPILHSILVKGLSQISQNEREEIYNRWIKFSNPSIFESKTFFYSLLVSIAGVIFIIALIVLWNRTLQKRVTQKTIELQNEIVERKQAEQALHEIQIRKDQAVKAGSVGLWDWDLKTNNVQYSTEWKNQIGYEDHEIKDDFEEWQSRVHPDDLDKTLEVVNESIEKVRKGHRSEFRFHHKDGSYRWILAQASILTDESEKPIRMLGSHIDITHRKQWEEQIKASLKEKETLLHEIHHRVKNNMQVINSLLKLQSNSIEDAKTKEILKDSQSRVYAMSAVHETLHGSESLSEIDLQSYLSKITTSIFQTYSVNPGKVKLNRDIEKAPISLNQAYPLGLTINELISNSLKYAFPDERKGEINVNLKQLDKEVELTVMDDGIGIPDGLDWKNTKSLGLKLVRTLVENQLDGSVNVESNNGTKFTIKFNIET
jgi:PAS domain S-box-containing protein